MRFLSVLIVLAASTLTACSGGYDRVTSYRGEASARHVYPFESRIVIGERIVVELKSGVELKGRLRAIDMEAMVIDLGVPRLNGPQNIRRITHDEVQAIWVHQPIREDVFAMGSLSGAAIFALIITLLIVGR